MVLDRAEARYVDEVLRRELQHERHDAEIGIEALHRRFRLVALERGKLEQLHALGFGRGLERIGSCARLLGRAEHAGDLVATLEERLED